MCITLTPSKSPKITSRTVVRQGPFENVSFWGLSSSLLLPGGARVTQSRECLSWLLHFPDSLPCHHCTSVMALTTLSKQSLQIRRFLYHDATERKLQTRPEHLLRLSKRHFRFLRRLNCPKVASAAFTHLGGGEGGASGGDRSPLASCGSAVLPLGSAEGLPQASPDLGKLMLGEEK